MTSVRVLTSVALLSVSNLSFSILPAVAQITLSGGVEHAEKLAPAASELAPGRALTDPKRIVNKTSGEWFSIPSWLTGTWSTIQQVRTRSYNDETGNSDTKATVESAREKETFGFQLDKQHNYWTSSNNIDPIRAKVEKSVPGDGGKSLTVTKVEYKFRRNEIVSNENNKIVLKTIDTVVTTNPDTNRIESTEQVESIRTFVLMDDNLIALKSDVQHYDRLGFPKERSVHAEFRAKEADFKVVNEIDGVSLFASFKDFLQRHGQLNIAPEKVTP